MQQVVQRGVAATNTAATFTDITITAVVVNRSWTIAGSIFQMMPTLLASPTTLRVFHGLGGPGQTVYYQVIERKRVLG